MLFLFMGALVLLVHKVGFLADVTPWMLYGGCFVVAAIVGTSILVMRLQSLDEEKREILNKGESLIPLLWNIARVVIIRFGGHHPILVVLEKVIPILLKKRRQKRIEIENISIHEIEGKKRREVIAFALNLVGIAALCAMRIWLPGWLAF